MGNLKNQRKNRSNRSKNPKKTKRARCALERCKQLREVKHQIQCEPNIIEAEPSDVTVPLTSGMATTTEPEIHGLFDTDTCTSSTSLFNTAEECMRDSTWCSRTYTKPHKQVELQLHTMGVVSSDEYDKYD